MSLIALAAIATLITGCSSGSGSVPPSLTSGGPTATATASPSAAPTASASTTPTSSPTSTAAPTAAPTATASSSASLITLNPTSVVVSAQNSGCTTTAGFSASEAGYSGSFNATSNNPTIVSVAPAQQAGQFVVTSVTTTNGPLSQGATITVADSSGHTATEQVTIGVCLP